jgi:hypothetical protein
MPKRFYWGAFVLLGRCAENIIDERFQNAALTALVATQRRSTWRLIHRWGESATKIATRSAGFSSFRELHEFFSHSTAKPDTVVANGSRSPAPLVALFRAAVGCAVRWHSVLFALHIGDLQ